MTEAASFNVDRDDVLGLRDVISKLAGMGYSESSVGKRLGLEDLGDLQWRLASILSAECLSSRDSLALAIDMFLLQGSISAGELNRLFAPSERDVLIRTGMLAIDETGVARARASVTSTKVLFSKLATPLTVATRLGIRSLRRWYCD